MFSALGLFSLGVGYATHDDRRTVNISRRLTNLAYIKYHGQVATTSCQHLTFVDDSRTGHESRRLPQPTPACHDSIAGGWTLKRNRANHACTMIAMM
jgi:hypothetical protein